MSTPFERLTAIVNSYTPPVTTFKLDPHNIRKGTLLFDSVIVKEAEIAKLSEDNELFELIKIHLTEIWNSETDQYVTSATVDSLWRIISNTVAARYDHNSARCTATKRKTVDFISKIKVDDKMLAGFLLQTYIKLHSSIYKNMSTKDREALFEQFDSLRRTFGKRI